MKIIRVSNFDNESVSDILVATSVNQYYGVIIVDYLNEKHSGDNDPDYYRLVEDDYSLYKFEP